MFSQIYDRYLNRDLSPLITAYIILVLAYTQVPPNLEILRSVLGEMAIVLMIFIAIVAAGKLRD